MMAKTTLIVCLLFVLTQKAATDLLIDASTSKINLETRSPLDINCTFSLKTHPEMAVLISLVLSRANATGHSFQDLASITQFTPDTVTVLTEEKFAATGVHSQTGESFLHVSWKHPTCLQGGIYKCSALGVNMIGRYVALTNTSSVIVDQANLKDIFEKLRQMKTRDLSMEDTISSMGNQILSLEYTMASMEHDNQIMKNHTTSMDNELEALLNNTTSMENQIQTLQNDTTSVGNQIQTLQNDTISMGNQIQILQNDTTSMENQIKTLQKDTTSIENQIQTLQNDATQTENQVQTLQNDATQTENQIQTLQNDATQTENQIQTLQNDATQTENQIQILKNRATSMESQIQTLQNDKRSMGNQIQTLQNDKRSMEQNIKNLEKTVSRLDNTYPLLRIVLNYDPLGKYEDHYYFLSKENYGDVDVAIKACKSIGGYLAEMKDRGEYMAIKGFLGYYSGITHVVIAGSDEKSEGKWVLPTTNKPLPFTAWRPGSPVTDTTTRRKYNCLCLMSKYSWHMVDASCHSSPSAGWHYLCELKSLMIKFA